MEIIFIEPLNSLIFDGKALKGVRVKDKIFGGFCECGGTMYQKIRFLNSELGILVSECESCWKNDALILSMSEGRVIDRGNLKLVDRSNIIDFLKEILSESELNSIIMRASGESYSHSSFSRAKKKLEKMNLSVDDILTLI